MTRPPNPELIKQIQEMVAETIHRSGIEGITLRGIAGQLGVTPTTIYYYFQNKEELLDQIKTHVIYEMEEAVLAAINPGDTCRKQLEDLLRSFVRWSIEHPRLLELVFEKLPPKLALEDGDYLGTYYRSQLKVIELLETGIAAGEFAPRDCRLDATVFWEWFTA